MLLTLLIIVLTAYYFGSRKFEALAERDRLKREVAEAEAVAHKAWYEALEKRTNSAIETRIRTMPRTDDDLLLFKPAPPSYVCTTSTCWDPSIPTVRVV